MGAPKSASRAKAYLGQWYEDISWWRPAWRRRVSRDFNKRRWALIRRRRNDPWSLFKTSGLVLLALTFFAIVLWFALGWVLGRQWAWNLDAGREATRYGISRMVLYIGAGAVGVIAVLVAYRRQRSLEEGHFLEQLAKSAQQLGDQNPTIQSAGIYALAGLADRSTRERRQQCVDVLCAYIRLPYTPAMKANYEGLAVAEKIVHVQTIQRSDNIKESIERTATIRPHDRETRQTIIRVITQHLQSDADLSWSNLNFDFTRAVFDYGDFDGAVFANTVNFVGAIFNGGAVSFQHATFSGITSFAGANFSNGTAVFVGATFSGDSVNFRDTKFTNSTVTFKDAEFSSNIVTFQDAEFNNDLATGAAFCGNTVVFAGSTFSGIYVSFKNAKFHGGTVDFQKTTFSGDTVEFQHTDFINGDINFWSATFSNNADFQGAKFHGATVNFRKTKFSNFANFQGTEFHGGTVDFGNTEISSGFLDFGAAVLTGGIMNFKSIIFSGGTLDFRLATFSGGTLEFRSATFSGGTLNFQYTTFNGSIVNFDTAEFSGGIVKFEFAEFTKYIVNFENAKFHGGIVDFTHPTYWSAPPRVFWKDGKATPIGVAPNKWPPLSTSGS